MVLTNVARMGRIGVATPAGLGHNRVAGAGFSESRFLARQLVLAKIAIPATAIPIDWVQFTRLMKRIDFSASSFPR